MMSLTYIMLLFISYCAVLAKNFSIWLWAIEDYNQGIWNKNCSNSDVQQERSRENTIYTEDRQLS